MSGTSSQAPLEVQVEAERDGRSRRARSARRRRARPASRRGARATSRRRRRCSIHDGWSWARIDSTCRWNSSAGGSNVAITIARSTSGSDRRGRRPAEPTRTLRPTRRSPATRRPARPPAPSAAARARTARRRRRTAARSMAANAERHGPVAMLLDDVRSLDADGHRRRSPSRRSAAWPARPEGAGRRPRPRRTPPRRVGMQPRGTEQVDVHRWYPSARRLGPPPRPCDAAGGGERGEQRPSEPEALRAAHGDELLLDARATPRTTTGTRHARSRAPSTFSNAACSSALDRAERCGSPTTAPPRHAPRRSGCGSGRRATCLASASFSPATRCARRRDVRPRSAAARSSASTPLSSRTRSPSSRRCEPSGRDGRPDDELVGVGVRLGGDPLDELVTVRRVATRSPSRRARAACGPTPVPPGRSRRGTPPALPG